MELIDGEERGAGPFLDAWHSSQAKDSGTVRG
jgi:hypothetical protein